MNECEWLTDAASDAATRLHASLWYLKLSTRCPVVLTKTSGYRRPATDSSWTWASAVCPAMTHWWPPMQSDYDDQAATLSTATGCSTTVLATTSTCVYIAMRLVSLNTTMINIRQLLLMSCLCHVCKLVWYELHLFNTGQWECLVGQVCTPLHQTWPETETTQ